MTLSGCDCFSLRDSKSWLWNIEHRNIVPDWPSPGLQLSCSAGVWWLSECHNDRVCDRASGWAWKNEILPPVITSGLLLLKPWCVLFLLYLNRATSVTESTKKKRKEKKMAEFLKHPGCFSTRCSEIYYQRNIITGQQNTSGPFIQSKLLKTPATSLVSQIPFCLQNCHYSSPSAAATNIRRLGVCPRVYVSFVLWWGQEQCSYRLWCLKNVHLLPKVCQEKNPPQHYTITTSLNLWYEAGWIHAFMKFMPNSDLTAKITEIVQFWWITASVSGS